MTDVLDQALHDPENQPSQFGTVALDDPNFVIFQMRPIAELDRTTDNTYLVRVEGSSRGGWYDKGYYADDADLWTDDAGKPIERGQWRITAFAPWPELKDYPAMNDLHRQGKARDKATLEQQIMDSGIAKNDAEWWAKNEIEALRKIIDRLLTAGNHIANYRSDRWPFYPLDGLTRDQQCEHALRTLGAGREYDMWCCWSAMMQARDDL